MGEIRNYVYKRLGKYGVIFKHVELVWRHTYNGLLGSTC